MIREAVNFRAKNGGFSRLPEVHSWMRPMLTVNSLGGVVMAMTFIDVDGEKAETDFTVVAARWRGLSALLEN